MTMVLLVGLVLGGSALFITGLEMALDVQLTGSWWSRWLVRVATMSMGVYLAAVIHLAGGV